MNWGADYDAGLRAAHLSAENARLQGRVLVLEAALRGAKWSHDLDCAARYQDQQICNCGAKDVNAAIDAALAETDGGPCQDERPPPYVVEGDTPGAFRAARNALGWQPGDVPAETALRPVRGGPEFGAGFSGEGKGVNR